jgi:hypothetical protein
VSFSCEVSYVAAIENINFKQKCHLLEISLFDESRTPTVQLVSFTIIEPGNS